MNAPQTVLRELAWGEFQKLDLKQKADCFNLDGQPYHVLVAQQFDRRLLEELGDLATNIRYIAKTKSGMDFLHALLSHKTAMLYFTQPSTRTFLSFHSACQILGMRTVEVRDTATSSEMKGETQEDSVRTFSSFSDAIIMRSAIPGLAEKMAWVLSNTERPVPILNAGSGKDQHPTQALLDIYTLRRSFEKRGGIDRKKIVFVGDLARGRTVRSLAYLLSNYAGVRQYFIAPPQLQIGRDILEILGRAGVDYELDSDFEKYIPEADAVYMTRIQDEWDEKKGQSEKIKAAKFHFTAGHLKKLSAQAVIMHPLPRRGEIAVEVDSDPRAVYWRQVRNGMWIRVALLASIFGCGPAISGFHGG
ncbi:MAG: aspartate carbamoyltransferase [Kiritimatiellae bacterium]|nr:aspartate carbamoyltransferase [Kiritimatiellia bacterium]